MFGRTRRFCLDGGRISSRSTGTPRDTRKSRRIRLRVQFGGAIGGGCSNCCHRERERSVRKAEPVTSEGGFASDADLVSGKMASRYGWIDDSSSSVVERFSGG